MMTFTRMDSVGVIGIMSGTSLDGLDICYVRFKIIEGAWSISEMKTKSVDYVKKWKKLLTEAYHGSPADLNKVDLLYGEFIANEILTFLREQKLRERVDLIASHGHTIFHQPDKGITVQIGNGQLIADKLNKIVIADFRSKDVSLGGQGAPLVPLGDQQLFSQYEACLNLGGIANISFDENKVRKAFDISPCNLPFNRIMQEKFGMDLDESGKTAAQGLPNEQLLRELNTLPFYQQRAPKSLGIEWLNAFFYPIVEAPAYDALSAIDVLRTLVEHETEQIAKVINEHNINSVLVTGGGAFNTFFMQRLQAKSNGKLILPSNEIIAFKEALIFAFLGLRGVRGEVNALKSVTGASNDSVGGVISYPTSV